MNKVSMEKYFQLIIKMNASWRFWEKENNKEIYNTHLMIYSKF